MFRTHNCGELRLGNAGEKVILSGWIQRNREMGGLTFIDLRDRFGITQLVFNLEVDPHLCRKARELGREFVIQACGKVAERSNKNPKIKTGDIEILVEKLAVLNPSLIPPFTIEDHTDGGEELRMRFRYLDLRRNKNRDNLLLRHKMAMEVRNYLNSNDFIEIETPYLIKSTPEGARDFVVPSRMNEGQFYALPQSPQTFKQLLMVAGFDRYFQIVRCFRDEDLRADRQPEFTQIDCEMAFVSQDDVLGTFEKLMKYLFNRVLGIEMNDFPRISYDDAIKLYGSDKPDIRFGMTLTGLDHLMKGKGFPVFDNAGLIVGINAEGCAEYSRKQLDELTDFVKRPQIGATGLVYIRYNPDGSLRSSVDKFFTQNDLQLVVEALGARPGDLILILSGEPARTRTAMGELRLEMGRRLGMITAGEFLPLWVVDFPLLEWDEESGRFFAKHHPFTSPKPEDIILLDTDPGAVRANAYDLVINGTEIGGGSVRIHNKELQQKMFRLLGFTEQEASDQFGFLMNAFEYGAPPHGGIAFGFDRLVTMFGGGDSIRDFIAFPKNNAGRDVMIDSPSEISEEQLKELGIRISGKS